MENNVGGAITAEKKIQNSFSLFLCLSFFLSFFEGNMLFFIADMWLVMVAQVLLITLTMALFY